MGISGGEMKIRRLLAIAAILAGYLLFVSCGKKTPSLNLLVWEGYADPSLVRVNGQVFGVPFTWGPNPMIYDITAFSRPPDTWNVFWDTKYRGKISVWDDLSTVYMAAQVLGYDKPDPSQLYNLSDEQLETVKKKLLELKPNIRKI